MTPRRILEARLRALNSDERGFTLLETMIAVTVMFGSLLALAYTATIGFGYQGLARQRQAANGLATQVMEDVRGLAFAKIEAGLLTTDNLSTDTNLVNCSGTYKLFSCSTDVNTPGQGESLVTSVGTMPATAAAATVPLVPHRSSTSPNSNVTLDGTTFVWSTYVTRASTTAPYRVTVVVTWSGGAVNGTTKAVRIQSLFWSPSGCRSDDTHPFAAPCQPFFFGTTDVPQATLDVAGTVDQIGTVDGSLLGPVASSSIQQEQIVQAQASWQSSEVDLTSGGSTSAVGGVTKSVSVDNDPSSTTGTFQQQRCPTDVTCTTGSLSASQSGNQFTVTAGATTASAAATTAAAGSNICPIAPATAETDSLLCAATRVQATGDLTAVLNLQHSTNIGSATVTKAVAAGTATTSVVQRNVYPNTNGCSPTSTADGCAGMSVSRTIGTINIGGLPSTFTAGTGWAGANPWNGYFLSIVGYTDTLTASMGTTSPLPAATQAGTLYYYNGGGYTSLAVNAAGVTGLNKTYTTTQTISGTSYTLTVSTVTTGMTAATTSLSPTTPTGNATRTDVTSRVIPPTVTVRYQLSGGGTSADLTVSLLLGTLEANGTYSAAPAQGS
jgi:type II secretory pathway pseudopilin PulG